MHEIFTTRRTIGESSVCREGKIQIEILIGPRGGGWFRGPRAVAANLRMHLYTRPSADMRMHLCMQPRLDVQGVPLILTAANNFARLFAYPNSFPGEMVHAENKRGTNSWTVHIAHCTCVSELQAQTRQRPGKKKKEHCDKRARFRSEDTFHF